jgi:hypothetical protein
VGLRRRRDRLLLAHHPDRGGDSNKAAEINAIYERMVNWLDGDGAKWREAQQTKTLRMAAPKIVSQLQARSAKLGAFALAIVAAYAALRGGGRKP